MINLKADYERAGTKYTSYLTEPITIIVQPFDKHFSGQTNRSRDMEVKVKALSGDNVIIDLKNTGKVYYVYQAKGYSGDWEPAYDRTKLADWTKLLSFIPPGGKKELNISRARVGNDYEFQTYFQYSIIHNELNGLLMAVSAYPGMPPIDIFIGIFLEAAFDSGWPVDSIVSWTTLEKILKNEDFQKKIIELAGEYGHEIAKETMKDFVEDFATGVSFVQAVWGVGNWAVDNLDPKTFKPISLTVKIEDPPTDYTYKFVSETEDVYFGSFSNASTFGDAYVKVTIHENGTGSYDAVFSTRTGYVDFNEAIFDYVSKCEIVQEGSLLNNSLCGTVTLRFYPHQETAGDVSSKFLRNLFSTYLLETYFTRLDKVEKTLKGYIEIKGTGMLSPSNADERVHSSIRIREEGITAEIHSFGGYAKDKNGVLLFNASFGSRFNVPLSRTNLTVLLPFEDNTIAPLPNNITDGEAFWNELPAHVIVCSPSDITFPVADAGPNQTVYKNVLVTFDGSGSTDNVAITSYTWTFMDVTKQTLTGINPNYSFTNTGVYIVTLNVTDVAGNWHTNNVTITVLEDVSPPAIGTPLQNPYSTVIDPYQTVDVTVEITDEGAGVRQVILSFSTNEGQTWTNITMSNTEGNSYSSELPGFNESTQVQYMIIAYDRADNVAVEDNAGEYYVYAVIPEFPSLMILPLVMFLALIAIALAKKNLCTATARTT
jgi:hypothetical protein